MNTRTKTTILTASLASLLAASPATAANAVHNGAVATPANRIVGLWDTVGSVRPCGTALPTSTIRNTLLFNAGGTVHENSRFPLQGTMLPNGLNQRTFSLGTWRYDPATALYTLHLRFDWYVDNVYNGYSTVDREMRFSADGMQVTGAVTSTRFAANGAVVSSVCGTAVSDRI